MRASSLTAQIEAQRDHLGRLLVDTDLRIVGFDNIYAAGDVALALADDPDRHALMSCQHA
ncbi:MAG: NAD(P)/FAD-dependent oxidoreductase, partial [Candidatus Binataceae bacterium]